MRTGGESRPLIGSASRSGFCLHVDGGRMPGAGSPGRVAQREAFGVAPFDDVAGLAVAVGGAAVGVTAGGAGVTGASSGAVTGVTTMPVTFPFTTFFCFLPAVWRAARVALALAAAAAFSSGVRVAVFGGAKPKSASTGLVAP